MKSIPLLVALVLIFPFSSATAESPPSEANWKSTLEAELPLLGHRNWIVITDSAYPLQNSSGIQTVETGAEYFEVVQTVLQELSKASHVRPIVFTDAELPFVPENRAKGISTLRVQLGEILKSREVHALPHEQIIGMLDDTGKAFRILVLKTNLTLPYTSVFLRLDCGYWSAEREKSQCNLGQAW